MNKVKMEILLVVKDYILNIKYKKIPEQSIRDSLKVL